MAIKVLTNLRLAQTAGIAQTLSAFLDFIRKNKKSAIKICAVNIFNSKESSYSKNRKTNISIISAGAKAPNLKKIIEGSKDISHVEKKLSKIIEIYRKAIVQEKPDLVLVNGTYYMPWCLFIAAQRESIPVVLHYHGVLAKETKNWPVREKRVFLQMERCFDKEGIFYIFPSKMTKDTVEKEIYKHKVKNFAVIPNPVPLYFFGASAKANKTNIGIVGRWTGIKNIAFCEALAEYNKKQGGDFVINLVSDLEKNDKRYKKLSKIMKIHPAMENKKLAEFYKKMGIVISPSHFETYGNVSKEALASGVPAMVSYNMGVTETFRKIGLKKWVINFDSVSEVYSKIKSTIGSGVDSRARQQLMNSYSPSKIFSRLSGVLESVHLKQF